MTATENTALTSQITAAASAAGLQVLSSEPSTGSAGLPTTRFTLALASDPTKTQTLELSQSFDPQTFAELLGKDLAAYFVESARRLHNPQPDLYLTLTGFPLRFSLFAWPFHESVAGADTSLVHGQANLVDGHDSPLHARLSAAMTVTFRDVVRAPEQPFAESFIYNAIRKTFDQGQLELVKSGNRQPVPVTTRYYSPRSQKFTFTDTKEDQRTAYLAAKTYWLSGALGNGAPVWLLDPRDAQYLNASTAELRVSVDTLVKEGLITLSSDKEFATPTPALMAKQAEYEVDLAEALAFIKPTFNEDMRGGHTNM
ncbi:hypothetical protein [Granulicella tundricola]|uniref:Uncharacterized protein n=1 Tax=Granulicella tundricola (strain ATCC BAA-1859 / DSM 23138 / MP5ACTX9) TaxID=1198114 RepID=E8X5L5_GRATM|nr:hypothetical protein [Granulicella tundricola]ADW70642.1 hypothetical protein AciX9_3639 [Granulicella tundricola MP5ACTX9]